MLPFWMLSGLRYSKRAPPLNADKFCLTIDARETSSCLDEGSCNTTEENERRDNHDSPSFFETTCSTTSANRVATIERTAFGMMLHILKSNRHFCKRIPTSTSPPSCPAVDAGAGELLDALELGLLSPGTSWCRSRLCFTPMWVGRPFAVKYSPQYGH